MATHSNRRIRESYELLEKKEKAMDLELEKLAEESTAKYVAYMDAFHKWQNFHDQVASDKAYMAKRKAKLEEYMGIPGDLVETTRELEELLAMPMLEYDAIELPPGTDIVPMLYSESARNAVRRPIRKPAPEVETGKDEFRCSAEEEPEVQEIDEDEVPLAVRRRKSLLMKVAEKPASAKNVRFSLPNQAAPCRPARKMALSTSSRQARAETEGRPEQEDLSVASRTLTRPSATAPATKKAVPRFAGIKSTNALGNRVIASAAERSGKATTPVTGEPLWGFGNLSPAQEYAESDAPPQSTFQRPAPEVIEIGDSEDDQPKRKKERRSSGKHIMKVIPPYYLG